MTYALICFDLDGTLVDTAGEIAEAANRTLADYGLGARPHAEIVASIGHGARALMMKLLARPMLADPPLADRLVVEEVLNRMEHHYAQVAGTACRPYPGCEALIERLQVAGVHLACVTNKEERHARAVLQGAGLQGSFELLIGGDTLAQRKPSGAVLAHAMRHFGVTARQTAHVGDSQIDIDCARSAGVTAWAVRHGYGGTPPAHADKPDQVFDDLPAIARHVLRVDSALT